MRLYDIVVLVTPDLNDDDATKLAGEYRKILADGGANFVNEEPWGRRRLAYEIDKQSEGYYLVADFEAEPDALTELDRVLHLADDVIRFKVVHKAA